MSYVDFYCRNFLRLEVFVHTFFVLFCITWVVFLDELVSDLFKLSCYQFMLTNSWYFKLLATSSHYSYSRILHFFFNITLSFILGKHVNFLTVFFDVFILKMVSCEMIIQDNIFPIKNTAIHMTQKCTSSSSKGNLVRRIMKNFKKIPDFFRFYQCSWDTLELPL